MKPKDNKNKPWPDPNRKTTIFRTGRFDDSCIIRFQEKGAKKFG